MVSARKSNTIVTIEEHSIIGGLGSAVAEVLVESGNSHIAFQRIGIRDDFCSQVGTQEYLRRIYGLSVEDIIRVVQLVMEMIPR